MASAVPMFCSYDCRVLQVNIERPLNPMVNRIKIKINHNISN